MKIANSSDLPGRILPALPEPAAASPSKGFGEILRKTLSAEAPAKPCAASTAAGVSIQFQPAAPLPDPPNTARVAGFIDLLEDYQHQLADRRVSLKGLDPVLRAMEHGREELTPLLETLPEGDGLKDLLNRALVTAELEIIRFRRGDYLPV
jgi:hypothetical protein